MTCNGSQAQARNSYAKYPILTRKKDINAKLDTFRNGPTESRL